MWKAGPETAAQGFARDQAMMAMVGSSGRALGRFWHRSGEALCLGRFNRRPADAGGPPVERRASGGGRVLLGPAVRAMTLVLPSVDWLAGGGGPLRPDQVLNRALRPLLAGLRAVGLDAFYPGRDLVTVAGRRVAQASFTVTADGVCIVEQYADLAGTPVEADAWEGLLAAQAGEAWTAEADDGSLAAWSGGQELALASTSAHEAFLCERGARTPEERSVVVDSMLGSVEVSAHINDGRCQGLMISGDLIAPFHTLEEITARLEGKRPEAALVRRVMTTVMSGPRNFVLGANELGELITRLA